MRQENKARCCNENGMDRATPDKGVVFFWCKCALDSVCRPALLIHRVNRTINKGWGNLDRSDTIWRANPKPFMQVLGFRRKDDRDAE
jgi:hypothetical protein